MPANQAVTGAGRTHGRRHGPCIKHTNCLGVAASERMRISPSCRWMVILAAGTLAGRGASADDAPLNGADSGAPAHGLQLAGFAVSGYLDASYNHLSGNGAFVGGAPDRVFDLKPNGLALQQAAVTLARQPSQGFGGLLNLIAGNDARVVAAYPHTSTTARLDLTQIYLQYATGSWTFLTGKFASLAGAEVIASPANPNFSRSILFGFAVPYTHTGVRATYAPSEALSLIAGVVNGWDDYRDTNSAKTVELGATYAPGKAVALALSGYVGRERVYGLVGSGPEGQRSLLDLVATWKATDALSVVLNYDVGRQAGQPALTGGTVVARWSGLAGYLNYAWSGRLKASLRAEYLDDPQGNRTRVAQDWQEITATLAWLPRRALEFRFELRRDRSDRRAFLRSSGAVPATGQSSVGLEALCKL
jgi:hypothetical protein